MTALDNYVSDDHTNLATVRDVFADIREALTMLDRALAETVDRSAVDLHVVCAMNVLARHLPADESEAA